MADDFASDQSSPGPFFRWRLIYRVKTQPVFVPPPAPAPWTQGAQWPDLVPIRRKPGLPPHLQTFTARFPGTIIPGTTVNLTMAARETKADSTLLAVYVIQSQPAVTTVVSIQEAGVI